jgi:calcineurin-like phosphoesterase family protein
VARWFTSDLHLGHRNIARYCGRPFPDSPAGVAAMDEALVATWNATVAADDEVWLLGDVALGPIERSLAQVARLHGTLHLVAGNHDRCWSGRGDADEVARWRERYHEAGFATIADRATLDIAGHAVLLSHLPPTGDTQPEDRYLEHRPADDGGWVLHGHVHTEWRQRGRSVNVGVDAWGGRPVAEADVAALVEAGPADRAPLPWPAPTAA